MVIRAYMLATLVLVLFVESGFSSDDDERISRNLVYGMYSGLALLLDVHEPASPNGQGVIFIQGCGWHSDTEMDAPELKSGGAIDALARPLAESGFTVFVINHRVSPRFNFPAHIEDAQRAVRWVKEHAEEYGIDPDRLAAVGGSSGGHLSLLLGLLPDNGDPESNDPVDHHSSKVSRVVALAPATDLTSDDWPIDSATVVASFIGKPRWPKIPKEYFDASPVSYVRHHGGTKFLLIHGDVDEVVSIAQSASLARKLKEAGASVQFISQRGVGHGIPQIVGSANKAEQLPHPRAIAQWLAR